MEIVQYSAAYLIAATVLFLQIIRWMVIIEVVLSWLVLLGVQIYIRPLVAVTRPIYAYVKRYIPTTIGMIEFVPIVVIILIDLTLYFVVPQLIFVVERYL